MLYFLEKAGKIAAALWAPPPTPVDLRRLSALLSDSQVVIPTQFTCYSLSTAKISRHRQN